MLLGWVVAKPVYMTRVTPASHHPVRSSSGTELGTSPGCRPRQLVLAHALRSLGCAWLVLQPCLPHISLL